MTNRRNFLAAGGTLAAMAAAPRANAAADSHGTTLYVTGMVWNQQLAAPMNSWLLRVYAKVDIPNGNQSGPVTGFATLGDDVHDGAGSHVTIQTASLAGDQLNITGFISESKTPALVGQMVHITGKVQGDGVEGLTVTIGSAAFNGAGLLVRIAIIAILIG